MALKILYFGVQIESNGANFIVVVQIFIVEISVNKTFCIFGGQTVSKRDMKKAKSVPK